MKIYTVYFSATGTTEAIVSAFVRDWGDGMVRCNLTDRPVENDILVPADAVLLAAMPVYAGRIPSVAVESLRHFKGSHTPVILLAVYGNRAYDDIFVEMQDLFEANGFFVLAAGAFIARHSIFPEAAAGRPDAADYRKIGAFSSDCRDLLRQGIGPDRKSIRLPGNRPYVQPGKKPFQVETGADCNGCGTCVAACPAQAIDPADPRVTDPGKCIHCARCIQVCPQHARHFGGEAYQAASEKFYSKFMERKEPEIFF